MSTQYHTPTRHIRTHATGHSDRDSEKVAYLVRKWILAEANIPVEKGSIRKPTRSFTGSSGTVASTSAIFGVRESTNVSKSFFAAR